MRLCDQSLEAIIAAVLSVNNFGLEKAYGLLPALREAGLTRPDEVVSQDPGDLTVKLARAGYDRGLLTGMMADRLLLLMKAVESGALNQFDDLVASDDREKAIALLCEVHGVGPTVAANALVLASG